MAKWHIGVWVTWLFGFRWKPFQVEPFRVRPQLAIPVYTVGWDSHRYTLWYFHIFQNAVFLASTNAKWSFKEKKKSEELRASILKVKFYLNWVQERRYFCFLAILRNKKQTAVINTRKYKHISANIHLQKWQTIKQWQKFKGRVNN